MKVTEKMKLPILTLILLLAACSGATAEPTVASDPTDIPATAESTAAPDPTDIPATEESTVAPIQEEAEAYPVTEPTLDPVEVAMDSLPGYPAPTEAASAETTNAATEAYPVVEEVSAELHTFQIEAWADNWFAAYLDDVLIVEDSVSITTERSFNSETATFEGSYPLNLNFILKDFKENDTGLEYIGSGRQQMGDGGYIMQITDVSSGAVVAVSNTEMVCTVIHEAPLDKSCESQSDPQAGVGACDFIDLGEPNGWKSADYDTSSWTATTVWSEADVSPKDGYDRINCNSSAELIWGPDLETNNTVLCKLTVSAP